jgi:transcriptional regulator of arginine metabolism
MHVKEVTDMPSSREVQEQRRQAIREILSEGHTVSQQKDLVQMLQARGIAATQSSVSRDLKEIGAVRFGDQWRLPDWVEGSLFSKVVDYVWSVRHAGPHMTLILTAGGAGAVVARAINQSAWEEIVGTVEGASSVLVLTGDAFNQRLLHLRLARCLEAREEYPDQSYFGDGLERE